MLGFLDALLNRRTKTKRRVPALPLPSDGTLPHGLITGAAGTGKSTLARQLAHASPGVRVLVTLAAEELPGFDDMPLMGAFTPQGRLGAEDLLLDDLLANLREGLLVLEMPSPALWGRSGEKSLDLLGCHLGEHLQMRGTLKDPMPLTLFCDLEPCGSGLLEDVMHDIRGTGRKSRMGVVQVAQALSSFRHPEGVAGNCGTVYAFKACSREPLLENLAGSDYKERLYQLSPGECLVLQPGRMPCTTLHRIPQNCC